MEPLVLLVHRIPYPPDKGDKIRSYHLLRHLAQRYEVHLGAFADEPGDLAHAATLRRWCADVHVEPLGTLRSRARMLAALASGRALSVACYRSAPMRRWLQWVVDTTGATRFVAFSAAMGQYVDVMPAGSRQLLDLVDVDSDKWRQYGQRRGGPAGLIYRREAQRLLAWERRAAAAHDAVTLVSATEAELFRRRAPAVAARVAVVSNGVDCGYFSPAPGHRDPYEPGTRAIVFTGAMDYWPNIDAVVWFADEILPRVRRRHPDAVFHVVGARPAAAVQALAARPAVRVVGPTPDMRPWLAHADLVVAPLRVARGIQNKVLEGFAMGRIVLATSMALEGLELDGAYPFRADGAGQLADMAGRILDSGDADGLGARMRAWVRSRYDWGQRLAPLAGLLEGAPAPAAPAAAQRVAAS